MRLSNPGRLAVAVLTVLAASNTSHAEPVGAIDEIQVTATRRAQSSSEVSAAVTVIDSDAFRDNKLVTDALQSRSGVFLQQTTPGQGAAIVRGLKGSEVLHLVDGFRLNNAIFRNAPTPFLSLVPMAGVDRVEVLRGAPASLYGSDAVGGVVQVVSRFPSFDGEESDLRREIFVGVDAAEQGRILRGVVEYGSERWAGLVSGEYLQTGDRRVGGGERIAPSAYESAAARVAVSFVPESGGQWLFDVQFARQPETPRVDELVPGYGQTVPSSSEYSFMPNERDFAHLRYTLQDGWGSADWNVDAGWQRIVDDPVTRDFGSTSRNRESNSSDLAGITVSAARNFEKVSWIAGAEYYQDRISSRRVQEDIVTGVTSPVTPRYPDDSNVRQAAIYVNGNVSVAGRHTLSGGMRYSTVDIRMPGSGPVPEGGADLDDISADAGWLYNVTEDLQIVANAGRGFRAPNVFDLGTLGPRPGNRYNIPSPDLQSEHVTQLDAGLRFLNPEFHGEIIFFYLSYTDRITSILTGDVTADGRDVIQNQNVSGAKLRGVEASAAVQLASNWDASFLLNYTWGEQSEPEGSNVPADRIPPLNGHLKIGFEPDERWLLEVSLLFAGRQDRLSPRDVRDVRIDPSGTAGWGTLNGRAQWLPGNGWQLAVELANLLDDRYRMHGSGIDAVGRNILLSVARRW